MKELAPTEIRVREHTKFKYIQIDWVTDKACVNPL